MNSRASMLCLAALAFSSHACAQFGYMRKGNLYVQGELFDQGLFKNNRTLVFTENVKMVTYTPAQVEEYGWVNGAVYVKRGILNGEQTTDYFLLRLVNGERTLYKLREKRGSRFFIEHDSLLVEIKREALKSQLSQQLKACGSNQEVAASARFKATSLKRAVLLSNRCYAGFFPRLRLGAVAGFEFSSQSLGTIADHIFLTASALSPLVGISADVPLGMSPHWFMSAQATYQQNNFYKYQVDDNALVEYQDNFATLGFPLLIKYRGASSTWRPFIAMGPTPAIYWQQQNAWLSTTYIGSIAYLNQGAWDNIQKFQISGTISAGLEYSVTPTKALSLEVRIKKLIDAQVGPSQSLAILGSFYF